MKKLLLLVSFLIPAQVSLADEIDNIVKNAIQKTARPCEAQSHNTSKGSCTKDCVCGNCTCDNCQCKPGLKCDNNSCQPVKKLKEPHVKPCRVSVNGRIFVVADMTASEAMAAIQAQGETVVFLDRYGRAVTPPTWYSVPVVVQQPVPVQAVVPVRQIYTGPPIYTGPTYGPGIGFGFGFQGPLGGGFQFSAGAGG